MGQKSFYLNMANDPVQEVRYVLWVFRITRSGTDLAAPERVLEILSEEGYEVGLEKIRRIRSDLEKIIKSPWMVKQYLPERAGNAAILKTFEEAANAIKKNTKTQRPTAPVLQRIFEKRVTRTDSSQKNWKGELNRFLKQPFATNEKISSTLRAIGEVMAAMKTKPAKPLSFGAREIVKEIQARPQLAREIKRALAFRARFNKEWSRVSAMTRWKKQITLGEEGNPEYEKVKGYLLGHKAASKRIVRAYHARQRARR